jgi:Tfp pilus assembly protein PilO
VPKGKPWTAHEEAQLLQLVKARQNSNVIAKKLGRTQQAIAKKINRLGLKEVVVRVHAGRTTTSELKLPPELPSIEEALKILAAALKAGSQSGLNRTEVQRLHAVANLARTYKELLADYIDYRDIEVKLLEMEEKYAQLATQKPKNNETQHNNTQMERSPTS